MKKLKLLVLGFSALILLAFAFPALAEDKTITVTGDGKCAKCTLHETDKCQNVIQTTQDGKTVTYYLVANKISKDFHENLCTASEKVTATGAVKEKSGKMEFTATKIEVAK